ncbi:MAG: putative transposase [Ancylomarina sp.]|jgi:putative transposase
MSDKYKGRYRIESARLKSWDYGWNAAYFVTICTHCREHYFGDIVDGRMQLSEIGQLANKYWLEIPKHFPFVELDAFVVMPNHLHGILVINKPNDERHVETQNFASLPLGTQNKFGPQSQNLASIIRGFKIGVTKNARKIKPDFMWQARFYDHIIRNDESLFRIRDYIKSNPLKWAKDKFYE